MKLGQIIRERRKNCGLTQEQVAQAGGILGVVIGTLLGNLNLQLPIILAGALCPALGLVLLRVMPEEHFSPALEDRQGCSRILSTCSG